MADNLADRDASRALMPLLDGVSDSRMRAIGIEAVRRWWQREQKLSAAHDPLDQYPNTVFPLNAIGVDIVAQLAEDKGVANVDTNKLKDPFVDDAALSRAWMSPFLEFVWWLVRAGLAVEHSYGTRHIFDDNGKPYPRSPTADPWLKVFPISMQLTARGVRLLERGEDDPLLPGFLDRLNERCPGLPDGVVALLADARECLDRALMRPAVILMGVAYELAIEEVIVKLKPKVRFPDNILKLAAKHRLDCILNLIKDETQIEALLPDRDDDQRRVQMAYDFADQLRLERNSAAHTRPAFDYEHRSETEEFLVSAGRHLPGIWLLATT